MKLAFAMLADSADAAPDGKITVMGGGIDLIRAYSFPMYIMGWRWLLN